MRKDAHSAVSTLIVIGVSAVLAGCIEADAATGTSAASKNGVAPLDFSKTSVIVEINATDGDAGFHALLDADAWDQARITSPQGKLLFEARAKGQLADQGLTENFFESDEPPCGPDPDDPEAEFVPLAEFLQRFPAGNYRFSGTTLDKEPLAGVDALTHNLPAAPANIAFDGSAVTWEGGTDLGGCHDAALIADGLIPDPASVEVEAWEVTVEPASDVVVDLVRVFNVQIPSDAPTAVTVPAEFVNAYLADGVTRFKVEIGAIEASGNRTFAEEEFDIGSAGGEEE